MKFSDDKGLQTAKWITNEHLTANDINFSEGANYLNLVNLLSAIAKKSESSDVNSVIGGLTLTHVSNLTTLLDAGAAVSFDGTYYGTDGNWGFSASSGYPFGVFVGDNPSVVFSSGGTNDRIDIVEIRPVRSSYDALPRSIKDPVTGLVTSASITTKYEFGYEYQIVEGVESATPSAPASTAGWIKIAEVYIAAGASSITQSEIQDVRDSNLWTTENTSVVYAIPGSVGGGASATIDIVLAESVSIGDLVAIDSSGHGIIGDKSDSTKVLLAGIATEAGGVSSVITCQKAGEFISASHGFTLGSQYYLGASGGAVEAGGLSDSDYRVPVFVPVTTNSLDMNVQSPQYQTVTGMYAIGDSWFSMREPSAVASKGGYPDDYDNAVSTAVFSVWWNEIGHKWNDAHVAVGDTDLSASSTLFYPTPPPGFYPRSALASYSFTDTDVASDSGLRIAAPSYWQQDKADLTGRPVRFEVFSGTAPTGLVDGTVYYLIPYASTAFAKLATSEANAIAGTAIAYTDTGLGTFRLVQAGTTISHALEDHNHKIGRSSSAPNGGAPYVTGTSNLNDYTVISAGVNTAISNASNETRGATVYEYRYTQIENVLPSGEPVSAVVATYDWTQLSAGFSGTWNHGLGENLSNLILMATLSVDGTEANAIATFYINTDNATATNTHVGIAVSQTDINNLAIDVGNTGVIIIDPTTKNRIDASAYYLKIRAYNPSIVTTYADASPATLTYDISTGDQVSAALPDPTSLAPGTKKSFEWTGGDGTYAFWVGGSYNLWINNKELVPGSAVDGTAIGGHGTGHMTIEVYNSRWNVVAFHDSGLIADSGVDSERSFERTIDGVMKQTGKVTSSVAISTAYFGGFKSAGVGGTVGIPFTDATYSVLTQVFNQSAFSAEFSSASTTSLFYAIFQAVSSQTSASRAYVYEAIGRWYTPA